MHRASITQLVYHTPGNVSIVNKPKFIELFQIRKNQLSFRGVAHTGVGISRIIKEIATPACGLVRNDNGDCDSSIKTNLC